MTDFKATGKYCIQRKSRTSSDIDWFMEPKVIDSFHPWVMCIWRETCCIFDEHKRLKQVAESGELDVLLSQLVRLPVIVRLFVYFDSMMTDVALLLVNWKQRVWFHGMLFRTVFVGCVVQEEVKRLQLRCRRALRRHLRKSDVSLFGMEQHAFRSTSSASPKIAVCAHVAPQNSFSLKVVVPRS